MLSDYLLPYWRGFQQLSAARGHNGFAPAALTMPDIQAYLDLIDIDVLERPEWLTYLQAMDAAWLQHFTKKQSAKSGNHAGGKAGASVGKRPAIGKP